MTLEICCNSIESVINANIAGCTRIELCSNIAEGGTTPSYGLIKKAIETSKVPIFILIRPRPGDFLYSAQEIDIMKLDIIESIKLGAKGFVFGVLNADGTLNYNANLELIKTANGLDCTLHRAFDLSLNPIENIETSIELGFKRILTSGCKNSAYEGIDFIKSLNKISKGKIIIMPGGGINSSNISYIKTTSGSNEFHTTAKEIINSKMIFKNTNVNMGASSNEYTITISSIDEIIKLKEKLK